MSDFDKRFPPVPPVPPVPPPPPVPPHRHYPHPRPFPHRHRKPMNHEADFAPMIMHPHIPHHFNFWCNKVIPLVYDDSLSYYELLAKSFDYLNHVINDVKIGAINIEELAEAFCELQRFVNDYFAWYQSKGLINYEIAITNDNYEKYLPDLDVAQMNTVYRFKFVEGSEQTLPDNLPDAAKPFSGAECVLFNLSNFQLKRVGNQWCEITNDDKEYSTANNYQLFITDKDIYFRENSGDSWGEWKSILGAWWEEKFEDVKEYVAALLDDLWAAIRAEVARATAAEQALDTKIEAETTRATTAEQAETDRAIAAENALSQRLVAEYERAAAKESELEQAIEDETDRAEQVEGNLQTAIQTETTRATNAEGAIRTDLNAEITRATARENEISADIADVARDLSEEIVDRQQADENLQDSIDSVASDLANEVTRATTEEQTLDGKIATETSRAEGAESDIRSSYIPNEGNNLSGTTLDLTRNNFRFVGTGGSMYIQANGFSFMPAVSGPPLISVASNYAPSTPAIDINSTSTTICHGGSKLIMHNGYGKAYYLNPNNLLMVDGREIAVKADFDGYIPNAGNTVNGAFGLSRQSMNFTASLTGVQFTTPDWFLIKNSSDTRFGVTPDVVQIFGGRNNNITLEVGTNALIDGVQRYDLIELHTNGGDSKAYYFKGGAGVSQKREIATIEDIESATSGSASQSWVNQQLQGYIPNAGNSDSDIDLNIVRNEISLSTGANDNRPELYIDSDGILLTGDNSNTTLAVGQSNMDDIDIHAEDGAVYFVTDNIHLQAADNGVTVSSNDPITVYAGNSNTLTLNGTGEFIIKAPESTTNALRLLSDYDVELFGAWATLNVHGYSIEGWNDFVDSIISVGSSTKFVYNATDTTINVESNLTIKNGYDDGDCENTLKFVDSVFYITNGNAVITMDGGRVEFENCQFIAPSYINNKVRVGGESYVVFKNCTFENVDVYCTQNDVDSIFVMENCYCTHGLYLEPTVNPEQPIKIFNSYFDTESMTVPTGETTINALVAGCRFATGTTLTEIRHHWNNTNVGD